MMIKILKIFPISNKKVLFNDLNSLLSWHGKPSKITCKDNGVILSPVTPQGVIKEGFKAGILTGGQLWIDMMLHRNILSHNYDFSKFKIVLEAIIAKYLDAFEALHEWFIERQIET